MSIEVGHVIDGKYRVVKLLGQGGMGAVYLAEHMVIGRRVALKVLLGSVAGNENAVARFEREAQAAARIGNDHILEIFDFGSLADGARYMVCEYLEGETLAGRLDRERRIAPAALVNIARQLLSGLGAAHDAGVVHRDLKPENVFVLRQKAGLTDYVKIIDFGISKFQSLTSADGLQMTATGVVVGTPCYLSPEQARGSREADARSDIYAVGVILYECVTGQLPFNAQNVNDLLFKIVLESPRPLREVAPDVDPAFAHIIEIAMARDPENRFQSAKAFIGALDAWATQQGLATSVRASGANSAADGVAAQSADVKVPTGPTRSLAPTPGTWADSHVSVSAFKPRPRRTGLIVVLAALAGTLLVAGAFALLRNPEGGSASTAASGSAAAASALVSATARPELPAPPPEPALPASPPPALVEATPSGLDDGLAIAPSVATNAPPPATPRAVPAPKRVAPEPKKPAAVAASPAAPTPAPAAKSANTAKRPRDFGY